MANEVTLVVTTRNDTKAGFDKAKADATAAAKDLERKLNVPVTVDDQTEKGLDEAKAAAAEAAAEMRPVLKVPVVADDEMKPGLDKAKVEAKIAGEEMKRALKVPVKISAEPSMMKLGITALIGEAAPIIATGLALAIGVALVGAAAYILHNNTQIVAAFHTMKTDIGKELRDAAQPMVGGFVQAMQTIDAGFKKDAPQWKALFTGLAPAANALATILSGMLSTILPGLVSLGRMFAKAMADPAMQSAFHAIASSLGDLFHTIGQNKELVVGFFTGLAYILTGVIYVLDGLVKAFGAVLWVTEQVIKATVQYTMALMGTNAIGADTTAHAEKFNTALATQAQKLALTAGYIADNTSAATAAATSYDDLANVLNKTTQNADTLAGAMADKLFNALMSSDEATLHWNEALTQLSKTLKTNKNALDIHKAAGQADREAILQAVQANIKIYDTMIATGSSVQKATVAYDANEKALRKQLLAAGLTKTQVDGLIGSYDNVPDAVNTDIIMHGLTDAINGLADLQKQLNGLYVPNLALTASQGHDIYHGGGDQGGSRTSGGKTAPKKPPPPAAGGRTPRAQAAGGISSALAWVGEQGAELVKLPAGSMVYPHGQSEAMASAGGGGGSVHVSMGFTGAANDAFATFVMRMFRERKIQLKVIVNGRPVPVTV